MSLLSVAQGESNFYFASNLDTSSTEVVSKSGVTVSSTAYGTITQNANSLTGNASYDFGSNGRVWHQWSGAFGINNFIHEIVFKKGSTPASEVYLYRSLGAVNLRLTSNGYIKSSFSTSFGSGSVTGSTNLCDGKFHHVVVSYQDGTNGFRVYVDGTLVGSANTAGNLNNDGFVNIGSYATSSNTGATDYSEATIDFFAFYRDAALTNSQVDTFVANHLAAFADKTVTATALTASALSPEAVLILDGGHSAAPATASATFPTAVQSALDFPTILDNYMSTLSLEQWYRFDTDKAIVNYGSGGDPAFGLTGIVKTKPTEGLQGIGALEISGKYADGQASSFQSASWNTEYSDQDFTVGFWVKLPTAYQSISVALFGPQTPTASSYVGINVGNGYPILDFRTNQSYSINTTTNIADNQWHLLAVKFTPPGGGNGSATIYIDGVQAGTTTYNGNFDTFNAVTFSNQSGTTSERLLISQFFTASSSAISTTVLENMYEYGTSHVVQAGARMIEPRISFNNAYNNLNESLGAIFDYRFDEGTNGIVNYGTYGSLTITSSGTTPEYLKPTKNRFGKKELSTNTNWGQGWTAPAGTFSTTDQQTLVAHIKVDDKSSTVTRVLFSSGIFGSTYGSGMMFLQATTTGYLRFRMNNGSSNYVLNTTYDIADGNWHHVVGVVDGTSVKVYVDGKQIASGTTSIGLSDEGILWVGGETTLFGAATEAKSVTYDEFQVFASAFSAQQVFEHYRAMTIDPTDTAASLMVDPAYAAGFGPTIAETPATATAAMGPVFPPINPMKSEAMFLNPNYEATDNISVTHQVWTASAQAENPGWDIGENNQALHMDASATFPEPRVLIPGKWNASPLIANPALMVDPVLSTTLGARVVAQSIPVKAIFVSPPAYKLITDDIWYQKLYLQHSIVNGERFKTDNLPGTTGTSSAAAFLKLFDDVTQSIGGANTNKIINNLPRSIVIDTPANTDTATQYATASNQFQTATPTPVLEVGTYDDFERKAVRFRNIQFEVPENNYVSDRGYSLEFTFKSTKSNQVIAQGFQQSFLYYQSATSSIGLIDGKLFASRATQPIGKARVFAHPDNKDLVTITTAYGNKRIDDGYWHHVIIQYGFDGRTQFWIDGQLDIQFFADSKFARGAGIRPYILGSNHSNPRWQSDFETSAWSYDAAYFVDSDDITDHFTASIKYEPIRPEPMTATVEIGQESKAEGNRPRALMLYFWPTDAAQTNTPFGSGPFTSTESPNGLTTLDYYTAPPQEYEGWDVFPVDITGYWVSDLVKKEAYGVDNIGKTNFIKYVGPWTDPSKAPYALINTRRTFRDPLTDAPRYIDLINDIDLSKFDMIMFKNYPNDPNEKDAFTGAEVVDAYFNLRESKLFEDFLKSLRAAVDTGLSLMVANAQLALDLKIVDRVETVPDMDDNTGQGNYTDPYAPTLMAGTGAEGLPVPPTYPEPLGWWDTWKNNRTRIVNTHPGITDYASLVKTQQAFWYSTDEFKWGGPDRRFEKYEHKNALQVGDEFVISTTGINADNNKAGYLATPFANVKAGKILTAFANTVRRGLDLIENPYKDYAQSIILEPGDVLNGTQVGGRIYVNFTEEINKAQESASIELTSDYWVNYAYENDAISLEERNNLLGQDFVTTETPYWSVNGMNLLQQAGAEYELDSDFNRDGVQKRAAKIRKVNKNGGLSFQSVPTGSVFFSSTYSWRYPMASFEVPSMPTRGFRWLSNREVLEGTVIRPTALEASATMPNALGIPDKVNNFPAQSMAASATIEETEFSSGEKKVLALPATATATIVKPGSTIGVAPMTANASMYLNSRAKVVSEDQVILYLIHVDPILYIREDVIK